MKSKTYEVNTQVNVAMFIQFDNIFDRHKHYNIALCGELELFTHNLVSALCSFDKWQFILRKGKKEEEKNLYLLSLVSNKQNQILKRAMCALQHSLF